MNHAARGPLSIVLTATALPLAALLAASSCGDGGAGGTGGSAPEPAAIPLEPGSPWPKFRGNAAQDGRSAVKPSTTGGALWKYQTGKGIFSSPVVAADGTVYIGSADRTFYALNPDGTLKWSLLTGEIIDSSALLDDQGRVYFGSGDGKLRALDAKTGAPVWEFAADPPSTNSAFINWFEGNVAMGPDGTLYAPNDNFFVYAVDRAKGAVVWRFEMPDQTWSLPAVDARTGTLFIGNNNLLPLLGKNTFSITADGDASWTASTLGTVAASPLLTADRRMIVGGFDGFVHAYDADSGEELWSSGTRDHIYASPALSLDGTIVQPSADGTVYGMSPTDGAVRWTFDTREPVRSSPAVDAEGNVYFGSGEGRLFVLKPDGTLRWSMQLVDADRNDINASPALGRDAIYIAAESGEVFSVPYDYCLRPVAESDPRCDAAGSSGPASGASLVFTTAFGAQLSPAPATVDANQPLTFSLVVRDKGATQLAILDASSLAVDVQPPSPIDVEISGDGKFVTVSPRGSLAAAADGTTSLTISGDYLVDLDRVGLKLSGGKVGGTLASKFSFKLRAAESYALPLPTPAQPGAPAGVWEVSRLALPLPTILPSYNQIGFDSLHYLVGLVEGTATKGVAWMAGARLLETANTTVIDPATKALLPLAYEYDAGVLTLRNQDGLDVEVMNVVIPFRTFRIAAHLGADGTATEGARVSGSTICAGVPLYGQFLEQLGLCNPQTDVLSVFGGANLKPYAGGSQAAPAGLGAVSFAAAAGAVTAQITGSSLALADHVFSILLVNAADGTPVTLSYGIDTTRTADAKGAIATVSIPVGAAAPKQVRAYLMVDTYPGARADLTLP
jgi:outer membrane protein assembly factor BamB